jgi:hypothetical protein
METETIKFLRYAEDVFALACPVCGAHGELAVPSGHNRNALIPCPQSCGAQFMMRLAKGLFAKPTLEFAFGPRRKAARSETQAKKKRKAS